MKRNVNQDFIEFVKAIKKPRPKYKYRVQYHPRCKTMPFTNWKACAAFVRHMIGIGTEVKVKKIWPRNQS